MAKRETPIGALVGAVGIGSFCVVFAAGRALTEWGRGDQSNWSYPAVGIAAAVVGLAFYLLIRRIRREMKERRMGK